MKSIIIILLGCLFLSVNAGTYTRTYFRGVQTGFTSSSEPEGKTIWSFRFDGIFRLDTLTLGSSLVQFEVTATNRGFVGFGFSPKSISDVVVAGVDDSTNKAYNFDAHSRENSNTLFGDTKKVSDWVLKSSSQDLSQNITKLTFQRLLKTTDPNPNQDLELKDEDVEILWFLGASDDVGDKIIEQGRSRPCNLLRDGTGDETNNANVLPAISSAIFLSVVTFSLLF